MTTIISREEYIKILQDNNHHFQNLLDIINKSGDNLEGNCFYEHLTVNSRDELLPKQQNLYSIAKVGNKILEIGFNAGHSALLFLLSNPEAHLVCFDICWYKYTQPCFEYIRDNFKGRIELICGSSIYTVQSFINTNPGKTFDILHIDGSHDTTIANIDFFSCFELARNNSVIIWDDVELPHLEALWNGYIASSLVIPFDMLQTPMYRHAFGYANKHSYKIGVCSLTIGDEYKKITKYGRKTKVLYCEKNGYDFFDEEDVVDTTRPLTWSKIKIIQRHLPSYDYIVWIDGDTLIMNDKIKLDNLINFDMKEKDIMIAQDYTMINTGVMFIKNTEWTINFLNLVYNQTDFINHSNHEQAAFSHILDKNIFDAKYHIKVLPLQEQNKINSYWYTYQFNNCFILHFPGYWKDGQDYGLSQALNDYCPIQKDDETEETYRKRMKLLEFYNSTVIQSKLNS